MDQVHQPITPSKDKVQPEGSTVNNRQPGSGISDGKIDSQEVQEGGAEGESTRCWICCFPIPICIPCDC
ncbi:hypothetical protein RvY_14189 [Ramazzottius varieornatus]|uniref:Uncharacterized protein n=1 Tax=Ramazzottius varieornatus TaxID=947166 RepID=A0A1D1VQI0_RAMVA|nr:hypothetical protein RvY_14189 [Ramazzottius varieornatus]